MFLTQTQTGFPLNFSSNVGRNPLKSGQCFLRRRILEKGAYVCLGRNPLKSGQCFLQGGDKMKLWRSVKVAIPSNRVNVSYSAIFKEGNRTLVVFCRNPLKSGQCFLLMKSGQWIM